MTPLSGFLVCRKHSFYFSRTPAPFPRQAFFPKMISSSFFPKTTFPCLPKALFPSLSLKNPLGEILPQSEVGPPFPNTPLSQALNMGCRTDTPAFLSRNMPACPGASAHVFPVTSIPFLGLFTLSRRQDTFIVEGL